MANTAMNGISGTTGQRYDVSQHAAEGGRASGLSRRARGLRLLEQKILESKNGAAHAKLLEIKRKEQAQLLDEQRHLDEHTSLLLDQRDDVLREIDEERGRRDRLRAEVDELEQRKATLHHELESDEGIVAVLESIGEQRAAIAAEQLGWDYDDESDGDVVA
jgi:hypothetical protein